MKYSEYFEKKTGIKASNETLQDYCRLKYGYTLTWTNYHYERDIDEWYNNKISTEHMINYMVDTFNFDYNTIRYELKGLVFNDTTLQHLCRDIINKHRLPIDPLSTELREFVKLV